MSKKNKNRQQPQNQSKPTPTVKPTLTDDQKLEIELKKDELEKDNVEPVEQLSSESEKKLKEADAQGTKADIKKIKINMSKRVLLLGGAGFIGDYLS